MPGRRRPAARRVRGGRAGGGRPAGVDHAPTDPAAAHVRGPADGFTALHLAAFFGGAAVARRLLDAGADPDAVARNPMAVRPLHSAVAGGQVEVALALIAAGADVGARQRHGWTPLHGAAQAGLAGGGRRAAGRGRRSRRGQRRRGGRRGTSLGTRATRSWRPGSAWRWPTGGSTGATDAPGGPGVTPALRPSATAGGGPVSRARASRRCRGGGSSRSCGRSPGPPTGGRRRRSWAPRTGSPRAASALETATDSGVDAGMSPRPRHRLTIGRPSTNAHRKPASPGPSARSASTARAFSRKARTLARLRMIRASRQQLRLAGVVVGGDARRVEPLVGRPVPVAPVEDRGPGEARLRALQAQQLEQALARREAARPTPRRGRPTIRGSVPAHAQRPPGAPPGRAHSAGPSRPRARPRGRSASVRAGRLGVARAGPRPRPSPRRARSGRHLAAQLAESDRPERIGLATQGIAARPLGLQVVARLDRPTQRCQLTRSVAPGSHRRSHRRARGRRRPWPADRPGRIGPAVGRSSRRGRAPARPRWVDQ